MRLLILAFFLTLSPLLALQPLEDGMITTMPTNRGIFAAVGIVYSANPERNTLNTGYGTLVGPKTVLTAAHIVKTGTRISFLCGKQRYTVAKVTLCPMDRDLAFLLLAEEPKGITPLPTAKTPPAPGESLLTIGSYGKLSRYASMPVTFVAETYLESDARTPLGDTIWASITDTECYAQARITHGDSGAPWISVYNGQSCVVAVTTAFRDPEAWELTLLNKTYATGAWRLGLEKPQAVQLKSPVDPLHAVFSMVGILGIFTTYSVYRRRNPIK